MSGLCAPGEGITAVDINGDKHCTACPRNTYNDDPGSICTPCEKGFDTNGKSGATYCTSMLLIVSNFINKY